ncbi:hypothetical protein CPK_ORF00137 [Chlamydia pneumoniae LPCoLN]|nr:hypothetical protein CPK_ORF00137 [Chlamydia pneumoniae LPCoLN]ETR80655.1 hypothetical protein X556_0015 [Chlamydia pneumoniae B21]
MKFCRGRHTKVIIKIFEKLKKPQEMSSSIKGPGFPLKLGS